MSEASAAEKLVEHRPCEGQRIQGGVYSGRCALHLANLPQHCLKCWEPWPCEVSTLTTRLAEAQEERNTLRHSEGRLLDRAGAAETRLAEVERERDQGEELRAEDQRDWHAQQKALIAARESAEQLLSEMAARAQALIMIYRRCPDGDGYLAMQEFTALESIVAKYDARKAEP